MPITTPKKIYHKETLRTQSKSVQTYLSPRKRELHWLRKYQWFSASIKGQRKLNDTQLQLAPTASFWLVNLVNQLIGFPIYVRLSLLPRLQSKYYSTSSVHLLQGHLN